MSASRCTVPAQAPLLREATGRVSGGVNRVASECAIEVPPAAPLLAEPKAAEEPCSTQRLVAVVGFYIVSSITTIMLNKAVLKESSTPLLFLWGQLCVAVVLLHAARLLGLLSLPPASLAAFRQLLGLVAINVVGLTLNTLCLANVDAVLYQVARSLILPMTVALSPVVHGTRPSARVLLACGIIFVGFVVGIFGERRLSATAVTTTGIVFGVLSSLSTSCHSFVIKSSFGRVQTQYSGAFDLVYYNNLFSAVLLLPVLLLEAGPIAAFWGGATRAHWQALLAGTALAGASGLLINLAGFLQIKATSPITHTVSSAARGVLQTLAARLFLGEAITAPRCVGIGITLAGSCLYSWFKAQEAA